MIGVRETVYFAVPPRRTEIELGFTVIEKSAGAAVTVTLAVPLTPALDAVTVYGPPAVAPAVKNPFALPIVPPPLTDHVKVGCVFKG